MTTPRKRSAQVGPMFRDQDDRPSLQVVQASFTASREATFADRL